MPPKKQLGIQKAFRAKNNEIQANKQLVIAAHKHKASLINKLNTTHSDDTRRQAILEVAYKNVEEIVNTSTDALNRSIKEFDQMRRSFGQKATSPLQAKGPLFKTTSRTSRANLSRGKTHQSPTTAEEWLKRKEIAEKFTYHPILSEYVKPYRKDEMRDVTEKNMEYVAAEYLDALKRRVNKDKEIIAAKLRADVIEREYPGDDLDSYMKRFKAKKAYYDLQSESSRLRHLEQEKFIELSQWHKKWAPYGPIPPYPKVPEEEEVRQQRRELFANLKPKLVAEIPYEESDSDNSAKIRQNLEKTLAHVSDLSLQLEQKETNLEKAHKMLEKLQEEMTTLGNSQAAAEVLRKISQIKSSIAGDEKDKLAIESTIKIAVKKLLKVYNELDEKTQKMIRDLNGDSNVAGDGQNLNMSGPRRAHVNKIEAGLKRSVTGFYNLRKKLLIYIATSAGKILDLEEQLNNDSDLMIEERSFFQNEIDCEKNEIDMNRKKLKKVNENLMNIARNALFKNKNLPYSLEFKNELRDILVEIKTSGYQATSKIPVIIKRPSISLSSSRPLQRHRVTKRDYEKRIGKAFKKLQEAFKNQK